MDIGFRAVSTRGVRHAIIDQDTGHLLLTMTDGKVLDLGGVTGRGIADVEVLLSGELKFTFYDGTSKVVGADVYSAMHALEQSAAGSASDAEAWAVGKRGGVDVPDTDPAYENHSEFWAGQAADSAIAAAGSAADAEQTLELAQDTLSSITDLHNYVEDHRTAHEVVTTVDYSWDDDTKEILTIDGTASGGFSSYFLKGSSSVKDNMYGLIAGERYVAGVTRLNPEVGDSAKFRVYFYSNSTTYTFITAEVGGESFVVPSNTVGVQFRVTVSSGNTANGEMLTNFSVTKARTNTQLDSELEQIKEKVDYTTELQIESGLYMEKNLISDHNRNDAHFPERGIDFTWNLEKTILTVDGGPYNGFTSYVLKGSNNPSSPNMCGLVAGKSYYASCRRVNPQPDDVAYFRVDCYNSNNHMTAFRVVEPDTPFTVPIDTVTVFIRVCVPANTAPNSEQMADFSVREARTILKIDETLIEVEKNVSVLMHNQGGAEHFALGTFNKESKWYTLSGSTKSGTTYYHTEPIPVEPGRTYYSAWAAETTTFDDGVCVGAWLDKDKRWMAPIQVLSLYREYNGASKLAYRNNAVIYKDGNYYRANGSVSGAWDSSEWTEIDKPEGFAEIVDYTPNEEVDGWEKWWTGNTSTTEAKQFANLYSLTAPEGAAYLVLNLRTTGAAYYDTSSVQSVSTVPAMYPTGMPNQRWNSTDALHSIWQDKKLCIIGQSSFMIDRTIRTIPNNSIPNVTYKPLPGFQEYLIPYFKEVRSFGYSNKNYMGSDGNIYDYIVTGAVDLSGYDVFMLGLGGNAIPGSGYQDVIGEWDSTDLNTMCGAMNAVIDYILDQTKEHAEPPSIFILTMPAKETGSGINTYYNLQGRKLCEHRHINLIDLAANMGNVINRDGTAYLPKRYYYDGTHMNSYGQRMRARIILDGLLHQNNSIFTPRMDTLETETTGIPALKLGNTTMDESQLQALLSLIIQ